MAPTSSNESARSGSMSVSDADSEAKPDLKQTGRPTMKGDSGTYPIDRKFKSAEERDHIMSMPEVEREQLISERMQDIEREEQNRHLRALLEGHKGQSQPSQEIDAAIAKRKAEEEPDDDRRKSTRVRTNLGGRVEGESNPTLEKYRRVREKKAQEQQSRKKVEQSSPQARRRSRSSHTSRSLSSRSAGQISDRDTPPRLVHPSYRSSQAPPLQLSQDSNPVKKAVSVRDLKAEATLAEVNRIRVGRDNLGQVCFTPGFEDKIKDCFGRIVLNPKTQEYGVIRVKGFTEELGKPFALIPGPQGREFRCGIYARAQGSPAHLPDVALCLFSNSPITPKEWDAYRALCQKERVSLPTAGFVESKIDEINNLINHRFTENETLLRLRRMGRGDEKMLLIKKGQLKRDRQMAVMSKDESAIAQCDRQLAELEGPKLRYATSQPQKQSPTKTGSQPVKLTIDEQMAKISEHSKAANKAAKLEREKAENERKKDLRAALKRVELARKEAWERGDTPEQISRVGTPSQDFVSEKQKEKIRKLEEARKEAEQREADRKADPLDSLAPEVAEEFRRRREANLSSGGLKGACRDWEMEADIAAAGLEISLDIEI